MIVNQDNTFDITERIEAYFNLIGEKWDTIINNVSFKIEMPKEFDKTLLGFSCGEKGSTNNSNVEYNVIGNIYTYVLGVSDKWIKQFKSITFKAPCWYQPQNEFRTDAFNDFFRNTLNSTTTVMSPKTSFSGGGSSSGGSSSGSSSSGGGSAGGGSGGGGGSSW